MPLIHLNLKYAYRRSASSSILEANDRGQLTLTENQQIASFLNVTKQTTKNYVHNLYMKLGVSSRMQLLRVLQKPAVRRKLGLPDQSG